ncbi:MAG: c-type cytochrome [Sulfuricellaceae bacterium]|nr:c-type cytochrome [Sulfuricellaceae bacterium]
MKFNQWVLLGLAGLGLSQPALAAPDLETGQQINGVCAACHGDNGQGGKKGEYPRLAGQKVGYLKEQLVKFKNRQRINLPMFPYTEDRELPDADIEHIATFLANSQLETRLPEFKDSDDALARLLKMEKVLNIPRSEGDVAAGKTLYESKCVRCHGAKGEGKSFMPMLAGQYTSYLQRQIGLFQKGERQHDEDAAPGKDVLAPFSKDEIRDMLAFLTTLDDGE